MQTNLRDFVAQARATLPSCTPYGAAMLRCVIEVVELCRYGTVPIDKHVIDLSAFAGGDHEEMMVAQFDGHIRLISQTLAVALTGYGEFSFPLYPKGHRTLGVEFRVKATIAIPHDETPERRTIGELLPMRSAA